MRSPLETISNIRECLKKLDIECFERRWSNPRPNLYSVRVDGNLETGYFGTNGKGLSPDLALASAYAEFMERLQNLLIPEIAFTRVNTNRIRDSIGFYYYPDEHRIKKHEFVQLPSVVIQDIFGNSDTDFAIDKFFNRLHENGYSGPIALPFFDINNRKIVYLPYNLILMLTGSNGMAAGNTPSEAIYQGLCEIMERYCASQVFLRHLTPPDVPNCFLNQFPELYSIIRSIESTGKYNVIVKSFSTDAGLPVVGVIIKNLDTNKYRLNVGCDTMFEVALSRCLTEIYQGLENDEELDQMQISIPKFNPPYMVEDDEQSIRLRRREFNRFAKDGTGIFPCSLFANEPDYSFDPNCFNPCESFEKEVIKIVGKLKAIGGSLFIRDVSFLGFPSYWIYAPNFSGIPADNSNEIGMVDANLMSENDSIEDFGFSFSELTNDKLQQVSDILIKHDQSAPFARTLKVEVLNESVWGKIPLAYFMMLSYYKMGHFQKSIKSFNQFIKGKGLQQNSEMKTMHNYLLLRAKGIQPDKISEKLIDQGLDHYLVQRIHNEMKNMKLALTNMRLPKCPDCEKCSLSYECLTKHKVNFSIRVAGMFAKAHMNQLSTSAILY